MSFSENLGSLRKGCSFGFVPFRSRSESEPYEDGRPEKFGISHFWLGGTASSFNCWFVRSLCVQEYLNSRSFVSWGIRSGGSCKPEFITGYWCLTSLNTAEMISVRSMRASYTGTGVVVRISASFVSPDGHASDLISNIFFFQIGLCFRRWLRWRSSVWYCPGALSQHAVLQCTHCGPEKSSRFIFHYNFRISWWIFIFIYQ